MPNKAVLNTGMLIPLNFTELPKNTLFPKIWNECVLPRQK